MNILWRVLGFHGIKIHVAALETPVWSHMSHSLPSVWPAAPIAAAAETGGVPSSPKAGGSPFLPEEPSHWSTLHQVSVVFLFGGKWGKSILCQWSSYVFWEWILDGKCGACLIYTTGEARGFAKAVWDGSRQHRGIDKAAGESRGCWRSRSLCRNRRSGKHRLVGTESGEISLQREEQQE